MNRLFSYHFPAAGRRAVLAAVLALGLSAASPTHAQGTVNFNNKVFADGIDAPIFDLNVGGTLLSGNVFMAQLYAGPLGTTEDKLVATGMAVDFKTGLASGYVNVGTDGSRTVAGVAPGESAVVQIRAWTTATGSTYEEALASSDSSSCAGRSDMLTVLTQSGLSAQAVSMAGLQSFAITPVPEPQLLMLGALGIAILLLRRQPV